MLIVDFGFGIGIESGFCRVRHRLKGGMNASCLLMSIQVLVVEGTGRVAIPPSSRKSNNSRSLGMVRVDMVFSQWRSKGWKLSISPACLHKAAFGGISGFPRDFSTGGVNWVLGFDSEDSKGCQ